MLKVSITKSISMQLIERRHAGALFDFLERCREELQPWIPFVSKTKTAEDAVSYVLRFLDMFKAGTGYVYGLWDESTMVGLVLIKEIDQAARHAEIGYMLDKAYQGQGLAKAACAQLIKFIFDELDLRKAIICCDDRNEASIAVATSLGFELEGVLRAHAVINDRVCNTMHWALFKRDQTTC